MIDSNKIGWAVLIGIIVFEGFSKILERLDLIVYYLTKPFGNRWILTVAESHQPYVRDWLASWGWLYFILMILGSILLVYNLLKKTKIKWTGTIFYSLFILSFIFSRYKANSLLNGENLISKILNLGSLLALIFALVVLYFYSYKKNKDLHSSILKLDKTLLFVIIWFIVTTVAARSAIRLLHLYSPITTIFVAYSFVWIFDYIRKFYFS